MTTKKQEKIKFSKAFWVANTVELFERAAYYGVFIVITLYLSRILGFNDIQAASIAGIFSACLYLLPMAGSASMFARTASATIAAPAQTAFSAMVLPSLPKAERRFSYSFSPGNLMIASYATSHDHS